MTTVNTLIYSSTIDAYVFMCFFKSTGGNFYPVQGRHIIDLKILIQGLKRGCHSCKNPLQLSSCIGDNIYGLDTIYIYTKLILAYLKVCYKNVLLHIILVYSKYIYEAF